MSHVFSIADFVPPPVLRGLVPRVLAHQPLVNLAVSNIPGSRAPLYLWESRMLGLHPFINVVGNVAMIIGVLSYVDDLGVGITVDPDVVGDPAEHRHPPARRGGRVDGGDADAVGELNPARRDRSGCRLAPAAARPNGAPVRTASGYTFLARGPSNKRQRGPTGESRDLAVRPDQRHRVLRVTVAPGSKLAVEEETRATTERTHHRARERRDRR